MQHQMELQQQVQIIQQQVIRLTFSAGETSKTIAVTVLADALDEANETVTMTLSSASNATISDATGTFTITDDDQHHHYLLMMFQLQMKVMQQLT